MKDLKNLIGLRFNEDTEELEWRFDNETLIVKAKRKEKNANQKKIEVLCDTWGEPVMLIWKGNAYTVGRYEHENSVK